MTINKVGTTQNVQLQTTNSAKNTNQTVEISNYSYQNSEDTLVATSANFKDDYSKTLSCKECMEKGKELKGLIEGKDMDAIIKYLKNPNFSQHDRMEILMRYGSANGTFLSDDIIKNFSTKDEKVFAKYVLDIMYDCQEAGKCQGTIRNFLNREMYLFEKLGVTKDPGEKYNIRNSNMAATIRG